MTSIPPVTWPPYLLSHDLHTSCLVLLLLAKYSLSRFIGKVRLSHFIGKVRLSHFIGKVRLSHFIGKVRLSHFIGKVRLSHFIGKVRLSHFIGKVLSVSFYWQSMSVSFYWQSVSMTVWSVLQGILMSVWVWCVVRVMNLGRSCGFCSLVSENRFEGRCIFHHPSPLYVTLSCGASAQPFWLFPGQQRIEDPPHSHERAPEERHGCSPVSQLLSLCRWGHVSR